jgi:glutathione synthase/RimK-type ligase-like ATP-grasp enzyme
VLKTAIRVGNLIGDGLYGVDLKEINGKAHVVEINDNPSIDSGVEDEILGDELYLRYEFPPSATSGF